uniref:Amyloid-beta A4 precursor protein-binding family A member 3 n=1 Tax=Sphaeramia orbicularis TaxID=375764 RepID=A0A673BNY4_9TELE
MAHGKRPGTISKLLAPSPPPCTTKGISKQSQEEYHSLDKEESEEPHCTLEDDHNDQLTPPAPAKHYYMSCDPSPEDMEDTCSEYDNVGSDVEQDYDEVLHLSREGIVDMRYYKQYCPEESEYMKHAVGENVEETGGGTEDQFSPRPHHSTQISEVSQPETKPQKTGHRFRSHCAPVAGDEAESKVEKGQENRYFFSDGDEIEEVLDGSTHMGLKEKERPSKGQGRRGTGEDIEHIVSGMKGCTTNSTEQRPKTSSKDSKKAAVRTKARSSSSKQHPPPPPRHSHPQPPADPQKVQPCRETPPIPSRDSEPQVIKPSLAPPHTQEQQRKPLEEKQRGCYTSLEHITVSFFCYVVPGPCEPEDLIDGIIFAANYLGCTQVLSDKNPSKSVRMSQAQEAVSRIKVIQDEDSQMMTEVDLFISTKAVKVLNADTQETMMDSALRTISYIADIGSIVVLMARRRMSQASSEEFSECPVSTSEGKSQYRMICYVFESEDAQLIAQSIGQAFSVAYREFLRANGINPTDLSQKQYSDIINSQEMYHDDLVHFSNSDNCKELYIEKQKGESLGVVIVESGWGSILPTVILANMLNSGPAARSGKLSVGDQIMSINDTSLVGLPLATCQGIIKGLKNNVKVKLSIVSCPPVTTVLIKRPDLKFQLGFSVQNGIICSLMRGGIAERGGVRVGHRIIEINGQSVVAMAHEKIVQTLSVSVGEVRAPHATRW